jgi:hypothetical protein
MVMMPTQQIPTLKAAEQALYDHFISLIDKELPQDLIERFRILFVEGTGYPDYRIKGALERLVIDKAADQNFRFILNRCCHILINRWRQQPNSKSAIVQLVDILGQAPSRPATELARTSTVRHVRYLVQAFTKSEQYQTLKRLAQVAQGQQDEAQDEPLGAIIHRYPYLYKHCLLDDESSHEQQLLVQQFQVEAQDKLEKDLSQFITYHRQNEQLLRWGRQDLAGRIITPPVNPTLLPMPDFQYALQQFVAPVHQSKTCKDVAQDFLQLTQSSQIYRDFKKDLYDYLTAAIDPTYGQRSFNRQVDKFLQNLNQNYNHQPVNEFLMVRTASQLMNFLVIESPQKPQHFLFLDLISNVGPTVTTSMLLKVVLFCKKVKPYLEKRFAVLFSHYERHAKSGLKWMVQMLENLNLAFATNFGQTNFSNLLVT